MITTFFIYLTANMFAGLLTFLPAGGIDPTLLSQLETAVDWLQTAHGMVDLFIDTDALSTAVAIYIAWWVWYLPFRLVRWALRRIPIIGRFF